MTPSNLFAALRAAAPSISIETIWEHDNDASWDIEDDSLNQNDFQAWQTEVRVSAIVNGILESGSSYLGGTWEERGDNPAKSNPDISGYLPQMIQEALKELRSKLQTNKARNECDAAIHVCRNELKARYDEQTKTFYFSCM